MFSRKKKPRSDGRQRESKPRNPDDFGFGIGVTSNKEDDDADLEEELFRLTGEKSSKSEFDVCFGEDDDDLEAELARILGKSSKSMPARPSVTPLAPVGGSKGNFKSSRDPSIDEDEGSDPEVDENDPELLSELSMLTTSERDIVENEEGDQEQEVVEQPKISQVDLIRSRLEAYREAEQKAKESNESSRARRFNRGLKTLEKLLKRAVGGETVPYDEIPPEIASNLKPASAYVAPSVEPIPTLPEVPTDVDFPKTILETEDVPLPSTSNTIDANSFSTGDPKTTSFPSPPATSVRAVSDPNEESSASSDQPVQMDSVLSLIEQRRDQYKKQALAAKKAGDIQTALSSVKIVKACDKLILDHKAGRVIAQNEIPSFPAEGKTECASLALVLPPKPRKAVDVVQGKSVTMKTQPQVVEVFTVPTTVLQALEQRLSYYKKVQLKMETNSNRIEARKYADIVRIYQNAVTLHKRGSRVPYENLPTPPGCPPIPLSFSIN